MALPNISVNILAVGVSAVASMIIGFIWYGPLFGKAWIKMMGFSMKDMENAKKKGMGKLYLINFISAVILSYFLAYLIKLTGMMSVSGGIQLSILLWLGFIATVGIGSVLWDWKPIKLYILNMAYWLVNLITVGAILGAW